MLIYNMKCEKTCAVNLFYAILKLFKHFCTCLKLAYVVKCAVLVVIFPTPKLKSWIFFLKQIMPDFKLS